MHKPVNSKAEFVSVCACVRWVVVYSQLSAPQGHHTNRDSWGLGPSQAGTLTALLGP